MSAGLLRIAALAKNTFREAIRDKILYALVFFSILMILFAVVLGQLSLHEEARLIRDMGLGGISFFSIIIAVFPFLPVDRSRADVAEVQAGRARNLDIAGLVLGLIVENESIEVD